MASLHRMSQVPAGLEPEQLRVPAVDADQLVMAALLDQAALVQHVDAVDVTHVGQPVRDQYNGPVRMPAQLLEQRVLGPGVKR